MLPSRLFKNVGIPPALRNPILFHPRLSPAIKVQLLCHFRLSPAAPASFPARRITTSTPRLIRASPLRATASTSTTGQSVPTQRPPEEDAAPVQEQEPRLQLTFTCAVEGCAERSTHTFARRSYDRGIVIVQCPGCKNRCVEALPAVPLSFERMLIVWQAPHCGPPRLVQDH